MAWTPLFLVLSAYCTGTVSQFSLTQPPSMSASLGETASISCRRSSGNIGTYNVAWYEQKPGSVPKILIYWFSTRSSGTPERFSGSVNKPSNTATLTISKLQPEDEADYYCLSYDGNDKYVFGGGTRLTVTGQPTVTPTVNVFPPSPEELKSSDSATLVCLMDGFYPGVVQVTWQADGTPISSGVETTTPTKLNDKYAASSYLSMKKSDWERKEEVTCKVTHEGKTVEKVVRRSDCA